MPTDPPATLSPPSARNQSDIEALIDAEAPDEQESRATKQLYEALLAHRSALDASEGGDPKAFSEAVRREASRRSAEITAYRQGQSSPLPALDGKPVPRWMIAAWLLAFVAVAGLGLWFWLAA